MFSLPLMKHILTWVGAVSIDRKNILRFLAQGYSVNVCSGGVAEVEFLDRDNGALY